MEYIIFTRDLSGNRPVHWYYDGPFKDKNRANEIALNLRNEYPYFHCVCTMDDIADLDMQDLPSWIAG